MSAQSAPPPRLPPDVSLSDLPAALARLSARRLQLETQSKDLAFEHYPTFIAAAACCKDIAADFRASRGQLGTAVERLPALAEAAAKFREEASAVGARRKRVSLVLAKHPKLLEVLELPQLMETCVKNNYHEEALTIQALCAKLQKPLGRVPLMAAVVRDVRTSSAWMLNQLLARLRGQVQLPECLKIIGYVRRMGVFDETQLRLKFLQAREAHFAASVASSAAGEDEYARLCRLVEVTRTCVFDALTQYRALFSDEDAAFFGAATHSGQQQPVVYRHIFSAWLFHKLRQFVKTLETHLSEEMEEQSVDSLMGQAMYFGQSLGRVGFDFRAWLVPVFFEVTTKRAMASLRKSIEVFEGEAGMRLWAEERCEDLTLGDTAKINFYALAELCNGAAAACNRLRYTPPAAAAPLLVAELQTFAERADQLLDAAVESVRDQREAAAAKEAAEQFRRRVVPFLDGCREVIFGGHGLDDANAMESFGLLKRVELARQEEEEEEQLEQEANGDIAHEEQQPEVELQPVAEAQTVPMQDQELVQGQGEEAAEDHIEGQNITEQTGQGGQEEEAGGQNEAPPTIEVNGQQEAAV